MGFELRTLEIDDLETAQKQNVRLGVVSQQRQRNKNIGDILNIGCGTRCRYCGFLHFMYRENCGACEKPMEYNLAERSEEARE
jgi:uncharacterized OB-fold protein